MREGRAMNIAMVVCVLGVLTAGCAGSNPRPAAAQDPPATISEASLGLTKGSVFDVPTPPAVKPNDSAPGELPALPRAYRIAPPRIPHAVADFLPITRSQNACLDCHRVKEQAKGDPTPIPPTHYTDYRNAPERAGSEVVGARYVCLSCHVARTDAPDLVGNRFRP
jgi:nitrate reductase (cytochrome), electron transfer subunit